MREGKEGRRGGRERGRGGRERGREGGEMRDKSTPNIPDDTS